MRSSTLTIVARSTTGIGRYYKGAMRPDRRGTILPSMRNVVSENSTTTCIGGQADVALQIEQLARQVHYPRDGRRESDGRNRCR